MAILTAEMQVADPAECDIKPYQIAELVLMVDSCNETGHFARECPQKPASFGKCFNCGEEGLVLQENLPSWLQRFVSVGILYANKRSDIVRPNVPNLVFSLGLVVSVRKKGMQLVTVRISRLLFVTIASKKVGKQRP